MSGRDRIISITIAKTEVKSASSTGACSLSLGDQVSEANERLPENELQMAAITFMQHGTHWRHSSKTT